MSKGLPRRSEHYDPDNAEHHHSVLRDAVNSIGMVSGYQAFAHDVEPGNPGVLPVSITAKMGQHACRIEFNANASREFVVEVLIGLMRSLETANK